MKRYLFPVVLGWLALAASARAQNVDTIYTPGKTAGKDAETAGKIVAETPAGIKITVGKREVLVPALEVRHVFYKTTVTAIDYRKPFNTLDKAARAKPADRVKLLESALQELKDLEPQVAARAEANRYVKYRMATTLVQLAEIEADKPARMDAAVTALMEYKTNNGIGWEVVPALKQLAQLQEQKKDVAGALKTYEELGSVPDLPRAMKQQSDILVARLYLRTKKPREAERTLTGLRGRMAPDDPQRSEVEINLVESQLSQDNLEPAKLGQVEEVLKSVLTATSDAGLKARAFNYLGDFYQRKGQAEDALWQYLRVETVYNQNVEERAKALYELSKLFDSVLHDRGRATECIDKLRGPQFADTPYAKKLPPRTTEGR